MQRFDRAFIEAFTNISQNVEDAPEPMDTTTQSLDELHRKLINQRTEEYFSKVESKMETPKEEETPLSAIAIKRLQRDYQRICNTDSKSQVLPIIHSSEHS